MTVAVHTELDALLQELARRFTLCYFGDRHEPHTIAGVYQWPDHADVVILWGEDSAIAYRMPAGADIDPFEPVRVYWWYAASAVWTLRAVLTLDPPGHPRAPNTLMDAPTHLRIPEQDRRPVHIRPPRY